MCFRLTMNPPKLSFFQKTLFLLLFCAASHLSAMEKKTSSSRLTSQSIISECALLNATMCNDQRAVIYWIEQNASVNTSNAYNGWTPLHFAAGHGNTNIGTILLDNKAFINAQDGDGDTSLHFAVEEEHIPFIELLLTHDANQNIRNAKNRTPMHVLLKKMHTYNKEKRKLLSKIHQELVIAHMTKVCKEHH